MLRCDSGFWSKTVIEFCDKNGWENSITIRQTATIRRLIDAIAPDADYCRWHPMANPDSGYCEIDLQLRGKSRRDMAKHMASGDAEALSVSLHEWDQMAAIFAEQKRRYGVCRDDSEKCFC